MLISCCMSILVYWTEKVTKNTVKDLAVWEISTTFALAIQK